MHTGKRFSGKISVLASLLLLFQLVFPMVNALAAEVPSAPTTTVESSEPAEAPAPSDTTTPEETSPPTESTEPATPAETPAPTEPTTPAETPAPSEPTSPVETTSPTQTSTTAPKSLATLLPPSNLAFQLLTPDDVKLTWSSVFGATGYNVYGIFDGELRLLGTATSTSYTFNDSPEGLHSFVVTTLSPDGESGPGAPVVVNIEYPVMQTPATFTYKIQNGNDIVLTWTASQYAGTYNIYQIGANGEKSLVTQATGTSYTFSNMPAGSYTYMISSTNSLYGESPISEPVAIELAHPTMTAPQNVSYTVSNGNDLNLKWDSVAYTTGYKVYQVINGEQVLQKTVTGTSTTFANMTAGEYAFVVRSYSDRFGESQQGGELSLTLVHPTMAAPANLKHTVANFNDVTLSWTAATFATGYKVYRIVDGQKVLAASPTSANVKFSALADGQYTFVVHSFSDRFGESAAGSEITLTVELPVMTAPGNFGYEVKNGNDIVLTWAAVPGAESYKVYQITGDQKVLKGTVTATTVTYTNQPAGEYRYEVRAFHSRAAESVEGSQVALTLVFPTMTAPANVKSMIKNSTDFTLNWDAAEYATSYKVYQILNGQKVLVKTSTTTSVAFTGMQGGDYTYQVHSVSTRFGESAQGSEVSLSLDSVTMQAPANLTHTIANGNDITLKWDAAPYATSYKIYQVINGQPVFQKSVSGTSVTFIQLAGGNYTYLVHSVSTKYGESATGAEISFNLVLPEVGTPGNLGSQIKNGNDVVLTWTAAANANSYKVYEQIGAEKVLKATVSALTATLINVPAGEHTYVVHGVSTRFGEGATGSVLSLAVTFPTMEAPATLTHSLVNVNDIKLTWDSAPYASDYKVYQIIDGAKVLQKTVSATTVTFTNQPDGNYTFVVHSNSDRFGESAQGTQVSLTLENPTMQAPANLTHVINNGNDIALNWDSALNANGYKIYQIVNGEKVLQRSVSGTSTTFINMPAGEYTYVVHSTSTRFGESLQGTTLNLALVHPTMQAPGTVTQSIVNGNDVVLKWGTAPFATNYKVYQIINGEKILQKTVTGTTVTLVNMPAGDLSFAVHSFSSRFGESPEPGTLTFNLVHPVVQPPVLQHTVVNVNNLTFNWNVVEWANEYRVYKVTGDSRELVYKGTARTAQVYNLTQDTHTYEMTAYSTRFGESAPSNRITETVVYPEMQAPVAKATVLSKTSARISWNFVTYANGYNVYEIIDGRPVLIVANLNALSYTLNNLSYKNHTYVVTSYSNSFGESQPSNEVLAKLIIDELAPVTTANAPAGWTNTNPVTVILSAADNETGVAKTFYSLNGGAFVQGTSVQISAEGINRLSFYSVDNVNNQEAVKTVEVKIDRSAPVTRANEVATWSNDVVAFTLNATDQQSGVAKTFYSIDGSEYVEGTTLLVDKEGVNRITFYSVDQAGNQEQPQTVEVKVDKTAPVTVSDAAASWSAEEVSVNLTATDAQSGVAKTFYSVNGSEYAEGTSFTVDQEGVSQVSFYSVDAAGNQEQAQTVEVKVDKTAPATASNAVTTWSKEDVTVELTSTDKHSGVAKTFYSVNGSEYVEGTSFTVDKEGVNKVTFYSVDAAGNTESVQTADVKIDRTAPVVELNPSAEFKLGTSVKLSYTATDSQSGIASEKLTVSGPQGDQVLNNGESLTVNKPGVYTVTVTATDVVGQTTTVQKQFVVYIPAAVSVTPNVIKGNNGVFTVRVDLPSGLSTQGFDLNSVRLNGVKALTSNNGYYNQAKNGQFKFERSDFTWTPSDVTLEFRGYVNGQLVVGQTTVQVKK